LIARQVETLLREAVAEDIGHGDITTNAVVSASARCIARLIAKQDGVISGMEMFRGVFDILNASISKWDSASDGDRFARGDQLALFKGNTRSILTGERVALNFLQHLSGIATLTAQFVAATKGTNVKICDTRKTTPLLRRLEKQAVVHGGGVSHRFALFDGILIKENHIAVAGGIRQAVQNVLNGMHHLLRIGIESRSLAELDEAIEAGAEAVILDNMGLEDMGEAVKRVQDKHVILEASGNVTLERVRAIAETGVHIISIGSLTHSAPAADLSLIIENV
jgi:nicotinate-nucleotide pyrophosphorylase (carboxylating)